MLLARTSLGTSAVCTTKGGGARVWGKADLCKDEKASISIHSHIDKPTQSYVGRLLKVTLNVLHNLRFCCRNTSDDLRISGMATEVMEKHKHPYLWVININMCHENTKYLTTKHHRHHRHHRHHHHQHHHLSLMINVINVIIMIRIEIKMMIFCL